MSDQVLVTCGACAGTGHRIHPVMSRLLSEMDGVAWHSTAALAAAAEISETHAATVLAQLRDLGRVESKGPSCRGGAYQWRRAK